MMNGRGKSDSSIVPGKPPNEIGQPVAEMVEERELAKGNSPEKAKLREVSTELRFRMHDPVPEEDFVGFSYGFRPRVAGAHVEAHVPLRHAMDPDRPHS